MKEQAPKEHILPKRTVAEQAAAVELNTDAQLEGVYNLIETFDTPHDTFVQRNTPSEQPSFQQASSEQPQRVQENSELF